MNMAGAVTAVFEDECRHAPLGQRAVHFKVVAPAGEFHAVVAHFFDERQEFREAPDRRRRIW